MPADDKFNADEPTTQPEGPISGCPLCRGEGTLDLPDHTGQIRPQTCQLCEGRRFVSRVVFERWHRDHPKGTP